MRKKITEDPGREKVKTARRLAQPCDCQAEMEDRERRGVCMQGVRGITKQGLPAELQGSTSSRLLGVE